MLQPVHNVLIDAPLVGGPVDAPIAMVDVTLKPPWRLSGAALSFLAGQTRPNSL